MTNFVKLTFYHIKNYLDKKEQIKIERNITQTIKDLTQKYTEDKYVHLIHKGLENLFYEYKPYQKFILEKALEEKVAHLLIDYIPIQIATDLIGKIDNSYFENLNISTVAHTKGVSNLHKAACLIAKYENNAETKELLIQRCNKAIFDFIFNPDGSYATQYYVTGLIQMYDIPLRERVFWESANFKFSDYQINNISLNQLKQVDEYLKAFSNKDAEKLFQSYKARFLEVFDRHKHNNFVLHNVKLFELYDIEREQAYLEKAIDEPTITQSPSKKQKI